MGALTDAIVANGNNATPTGEAIAALVSADKGFSGSGGTGATVTGSDLIDAYTLCGFIPRMVRFDGEGNFGFKTLDGNSHVIAVADNETICAVFIKSIYPASYATAGLRTTATGVHFFG
jgi:hypothetical protein